mgnify:CR=1 FL=1
MASSGHGGGDCRRRMAPSAAVAKLLLDGDAKDILEEARRTLEAIKGPEDQS